MKQSSKKTQAELGKDLAGTPQAVAEVGAEDASAKPTGLRKSAKQPGVALTEVEALAVQRLQEALDGLPSSVVIHTTNSKVEVWKRIPDAVPGTKMYESFPLKTKAHL